MEPNSAEELCEPALNTHLNIVPPNGGESWAFIHQTLSGMICKLLSVGINSPALLSYIACGQALVPEQALRKSHSADSWKGVWKYWNFKA